MQNFYTSVFIPAGGKILPPKTVNAPPQENLLNVVKMVNGKWLPIL